MTLILILILTILAIILRFLLSSMTRPKNYPPGPLFIPYFGNTIQLRKDARSFGGQHLVFEKWAKEYNTNILGLKLGNELVVVVFSYDIVHKVQLEEVFEGRPDNFFLRLRTMGTRKGITCTDGQLWLDHRNWAVRQMKNVGYGRSEMQRQIEDEAKSLIDCIQKIGGDPVWPGAFLATSVINVIWTLTAGKRFERTDKRLKRLLGLLNYRSKIFDMSGGLLTQFPWLRYIMPVWTGYKLVKELNQELYNFFMECLEEHKQDLELKKTNKSDLIFAYLREMKSRSSNEESSSLFNETQLIMTVLDLFIAGSQTTSNTLDLAIMMLVLHPDVQSRIHEEISSNKKEEFGYLNSREIYPYTNAFLMEVQRFFHIVPISGPRRTLRDTMLAGYRIPKNTTVLINLRSVHMDENHWQDPLNFRPERFLDERGKVKIDEYFMPFGQGRRRCLGDSLARACLFSFIAEVVDKFKIESCDSDRPNLVLQSGITLSARPYNVRFLKRKV